MYAIRSYYGRNIQWRNSYGQLLQRWNIQRWNLEKNIHHIIVKHFNTISLIIIYLSRRLVLILYQDKPPAFQAIANQQFTKRDLIYFYITKKLSILVEILEE